MQQSAPCAGGPAGTVPVCALFCRLRLRDYRLGGLPAGQATLRLDRLVDGAADATVMPAFGVGAANRTAEGLRDQGRAAFSPPGQGHVNSPEDAGPQ